MLSRVKNKLFQSKSPKQFDVKILTEQIEEISLNKESNLAICIENTGSSYLGVKNATLNLFPNSTIVLPAYYSNILLTERDFRILSEEIKKYQFKIEIWLIKFSLSSIFSIMTSNINMWN